MKTLNLFLLILFVSCSMLERDQGTYGAMIFDKAEFNPGQAPILIKDRSYSLWSEGCGIPMLKVENHFKKMLEEYKKESSEHMVGIADVKIKTYHKFIIFSALPCMRIEARPFIVKSCGKAL